MEDGVQLQRKCFGCGRGDAGCNGSQMGKGGGVCKREWEVDGTVHAAAERNDGLLMGDIGKERKRRTQQSKFVLFHERTLTQPK